MLLQDNEYGFSDKQVHKDIDEYHLFAYEMVFVGSNVDLRNCLKIEPRIKRYCAHIKNPQVKIMICQGLILKLNR